MDKKNAKEKVRSKNFYGIDVFVMVEADSEEEAEDILRKCNTVLEIMKVRGYVDITEENV